MPVMHWSVDARDDATAAFGRTVASLRRVEAATSALITAGSRLRAEIDTAVLGVSRSLGLVRDAASAGAAANALHPGLTGTGIVDTMAPPLLRPSTGLIERLMPTPEQGARAALHLASAPGWLG